MILVDIIEGLTLLHDERDFYPITSHLPLTVSTQP